MENTLPKNNYRDEKQRKKDEKQAKSQRKYRELMERKNYYRFIRELMFYNYIGLIDTYKATKLYSEYCSDKKKFNIPQLEASIVNIGDKKKEFIIFFKDCDYNLVIKKLYPTFFIKMNRVKSIRTVSKHLLDDYINFQNKLKAYCEKDKLIQEAIKKEPIIEQKKEKESEPIVKAESVSTIIVKPEMSAFVALYKRYRNRELSKKAVIQELLKMGITQKDIDAAGAKVPNPYKINNNLSKLSDKYSNQYSWSEARQKEYREKHGI